jgi:hypothetical protein
LRGHRQLKKKSNIKAGSIEGEIGDHIPLVIGRDKLDLNTSAATLKVTTQKRSRSNQPDHGNAQAVELVNSAKDERNTGGKRAGSPNSRTKSRSWNVDTSSSLGDTAGQAPFGAPISAPIGAGKSIRGISSTSAQAAAHDAKQQTKSFSGRSRSNQPDYAIAQVDELVNPAKDELNTGEGTAGSPESRTKNVDSSSSFGDTAGQAHFGAPIAAPIGTGKSIRGTSSTSAQAAAHDAKQQIKSFSSRSRSNQPDHGITQVDELLNPAKFELNTGGERAGSSKSRTKSRSSNVDSSSPLGDTPSQAPVGAPIAAPIGAGKSIRGTPSTSAQAAAHDVKQQTKSFSRSQSNQPDHAISQAGEIVNPPKDELNAGGETAGSPKSGVKSQWWNVDSSSSSLGDTPSQAPVGAPIAAPIGAGKSIRGTSSTSAQAAAHDAKQQTKSFSGHSQSNQPDHAFPGQVSSWTHPKTS